MFFSPSSLQSTTPICMFYFAHPFGISTPSSVETTKKRHKKSTKYTTTTYLVTEIQKNVDESSQDECCDHLKSNDMIPWPKNLLLPPPIIRQLMETKQGRRTTYISLKQSAEHERMRCRRNEKENETNDGEWKIIHIIFILLFFCVFPFSISTKKKHEIETLSTLSCWLTLGKCKCEQNVNVHCKYFFRAHLLSHRAISTRVDLIL